MVLNLRSELYLNQSLIVSNLQNQSETYRQTDRMTTITLPRMRAEVNDVILQKKIGEENLNNLTCTSSNSSTHKRMHT